MAEQMPSKEVKPSDPGGPSESAILTMVDTRWTQAMSRYSPFMTKVARWYDIYRGTYTGRAQAFRNNISLPFLFSVIQSDVARKVQTSFGGWPIVTFQNYSHEDSNIATLNETLISAQMKDCGAFRKAVDVYMSADMYGTGIIRVGWNHKRKLQNRRVMGMDESGRPAEQVESKYVDLFDGPDFSVVDLLDFIPQGGKRTIQECDWVMERYFLDYSDLEEMAALGELDAAQVARVKDTNMDKARTNMAERTNIYRTYGDYDTRRSEKYAKPVEVVEMWGLVPPEFAPDGNTHRVITVANGAVVLRNRPNPFWHGQLPYLAYSPMPDPHYFHGPGKIEIAEKMQYAANRFANQKMDALDNTIDPMWLVDKQRGINTAELMTRAGRVIGVDGPVDDTVIRPISPDLRGLQMSYTEIGTLWNYIQQATGIIEDTVQGAPSGNRQTAREFLGRQENVLTRLMLESRLAEEELVEPLANMFVMLNKQFLKVPKRVQIAGQSATVDPITGYPSQDIDDMLSLDDINHDYKARAVGATQMMGKAIRQQNFLGWFQTITQNPVAVKLVNWAAVLKLSCEIFDMKNFDQILLQQPAQVNEDAVNGPQDPTNAALESGMNAMLGPNSPGGSDIPPDVMEQITQEMMGARNG